LSPAATGSDRRRASRFATSREAVGDADSDRTAYGHIAVGVDDLDATLVRLRELGIEPEREPYRVREGGSRLAFVRDPDS
jgi:catechol 2,3-dioxygenase-like lactoylglutathione lyase family enzyme